MAFKNYREESRIQWGSTQDADLNREQRIEGCILRIADATELMAKNYAALIAERDQALRSEAYWRDLYEKCSRRRSALKGVVTKLKKART